MKPKRRIFRDIYLTSISFICGLMFIVQCGGGTNAIADVTQSISNALGIDYDNTSSELVATDVKGALDELARRFPVVKDSNNENIGILLNFGTTGWQVWSSKHNVVFTLDPRTGEHILENEERAYFENANCTGSVYGVHMYNSGFPHSTIYHINGTSYIANLASGSYLDVNSNDSIQSYRSSYDDADDKCITTNNSISTLINEYDLPYITLIELKETEITDFAGPLHI